MITYQITIQNVTDHTVPSDEFIRHVAEKTLMDQTNSAELHIRLVNKEEMISLNARFRRQNKPTNVLSFPFSVPNGVQLDVPILGDIVICAEVVNQEAKDQNKIKHEHWAHMIIHGVLHLLGFDHVENDDAEKMENLESKIMLLLLFQDPYKTDRKHHS